MSVGSQRRHLGLLIVAAVSCLAPAAGHAGEHPRLLLTPTDLPRLRHACGVGQGPDAPGEWGKFAARAADYQALRGHFAKHAPEEPLPGELLAAAFLHLVDKSDPGDADRLQLIAAAVKSPNWVTTDPLELVLALDWTWPDLDAAARRDFVFSMRSRAEPLTPADSPLEPRRFRERLAALALALSIDELDESNPSWTAVRQRLLEAGRKYFETTFPVFVEWRGLSPTGPAVAAREESDAALAIELAGRLLERDLWPDYARSVGRWLEHYLLATLEHPTLKHNFIRDDGSAAPLTPAPAYRELLPLTAHLLAVRTRDPGAALVAGRVEDGLRGFADRPSAPRCRSGSDQLESLSVLWRWVPIAFEAAQVPRCDPRRLPAARNLGGAVVFRGGSGPDTTAVWIDAAQPFLRRRQHFDAGHFLIYRGGHLVVDGGDDITFDATPSRGGAQRLGQQPEPFDFEQYCTASIAHNCLLVWDAAWVSRWYGAVYQPAGGQRCIEGTCNDFVLPLAAQARQTGRQLAYSQHKDAAYLALDLTAAYESRAVASYTREFIFACGRVLVVIDRVTLSSSRTTPTWVLNLPAPPQVDGQSLRDDARIAGGTNEGGVWRYDDANWLRWTDGGGAVWLTCRRPTPRRLRIVGGPARQITVEHGPALGKTYVGGDVDGFERLIIPAERHGAANAWYRLGTPTGLGPEFGKTPHWGRIEIEPSERSATCVFLTVLVTDGADEKTAPTVEVDADDERVALKLRAGDDRVTLRLPTGMERGGQVELPGPESVSWTLPQEVQPDKPLPPG